MSAPLERKLPQADSDPLLLAAFNATADALVVMDNSQCVQHINLAASALLDVSVVEAVGRPWREIVQFVAGGPADHGADCTALAMAADHATLRARWQHQGGRGTHRRSHRHHQRRDAGRPHHLARL